MIDTGWFQLLTAALGGGLVVKVLDVLYQEFRGWSDRSRSARRFVDEHLDPLLKAADEVVGKLRSLGESDFRGLHNVEPNTEAPESLELSSVLFLFGRFWARIEIIRKEGLSIAMSRDERGKKLQSFLDCLESRRVRIVDRIAQRAVGETMVERQGNDLDTLTFIKFVKAYETDAEMRRWTSPLVRVLARTQHTSHRQRLLLYGAVVHALIDTLDPNHYVTGNRPSYPNKLTRRSWRDLKYRVFGLYLQFVPHPEKYLGPQKKGAAKEREKGKATR